MQSATKQWVSTKNPCNEFIVDYLLKIRMAAQKAHNDRKFIIYSVAMNSVKRYPLPIICKSQLLILNGIGDVISDEITKVIKQHYKNYLNQRAEQTANFNSVQEVRSDTEKLADSDNEDKSIRNPKRRLNNLVDVGDSQSVRSEVISRAYKPRTNTTAGYILMALTRICSDNIFHIKSDIAEFISQHFSQENIKSWCGLKNLETHQYIEISSHNASEFRLTEKGRNVGEELLQKSVQTMSKAKVMGSVKEFKTLTQIANEQSEQVTSQLIKKPVAYTKESVLTLIVDCREMKDRSDRDYFQDKLCNRHKINCKTGSIAIGDFIWMLDGEVLDYILERKKADDLASSIHDGRYKEQKYRLRASGLTNIFYMYEGHPSTNSVKSQKQLENALLKTRIKEKFKVVKTKDINQSIKFLVFMHKEIEKMIFKQKQLVSVGNLEEFNKRNSKSGALTIETAFGLGIKCFPGIGKNVVSQLVKYFKSFQMMKSKLSSLPTKDERIQFLKQLLKGGRTPSTFPKLIVQFLFNDSYTS